MTRLFCKQRYFWKKLNFDNLNGSYFSSLFQKSLETELRVLGPFGIKRNEHLYTIAQRKETSEKLGLTADKGSFERWNLQTRRVFLKRNRNCSKSWLIKEPLFHGSDLLMRTHVQKEGVRQYCSHSGSGENDDDIDGIDENDAENIIDAKYLLEDDEYNQCLKDFCILTDTGHKVFIVQIELTGSKRNEILSPIQHQLAENEALVQSIPQWSVAGSKIVKVRAEHSVPMMSRAFKSAVDEIRSTPNVSAVFISRNKLSPELRTFAHQLFKLPVFDRSFILIMVFKFQAQTKEAKLHLALAELPFLRFCMKHGFEPGKYGRPEKRYLNYPFAERERKLQAALKVVEKQHRMTRDRRNNRQIPTIAVIGYTNCGKTTIIKALTGDKDMTPRNKLFATLDVTAHGGVLPNNMLVVYMDTVGFLTYLPPNLRGAFTATLEDTLHSDLIIHVRDVSHPDMLAQELNVIESIQNLVPQNKLDTMINVYNKVDRIKKSERESIMGIVVAANVFEVSAVTGEGLEQLRQEIQTRLLQNVGFLQKTLKIPLHGDHLRWLYKEATVVSTKTDDNDTECLIVTVHISKANYGRFMAYFGHKRATAAR